MNPHERISNQDAAILSRYFKFREPCTRVIPSYTYKKMKDCIMRFDFNIQVPTVIHTIVFLQKEGYDITLETFEDDLTSILGKFRNCLSPSSVREE